MDALSATERDLAQTLRAYGATMQSSPPQKQRARQLLQTTLADLREQGRAGVPLVAPRWLRWPVISFRMMASFSALAASAVVAVALVLGAGGLGLKPGTTEAVTLDGDVQSINSGRLLFVDVSSVVHESTLPADVAVVDAFGNDLGAACIAPGERVSLSGRRDGDGLVAERVVLVTKLFGRIAAVEADSLLVSGGSGTFRVHLTPETKLEGRLSQGALVEIELLRSPDGALVADEVEVEDDDERQDTCLAQSKDRESAPAASTGTAPAASSSGKDSSNGKDGEENDDDPTATAEVTAAATSTPDDHDQTGEGDAEDSPEGTSTPTTQAEDDESEAEAQETPEPEHDDEPEDDYEEDEPGD
ncbi:MAG TPA: DUF5666 domain-containing protein [Dehalococcoidia bacterium]|nr:DUF5666 domain-containing protein [Dehalococcoidia bacterium]